MNSIDFSLLLPHSAQQLYVAYSGGIDSHVLLHLLATQPQFQPKITAVHVHHGLQAAADDWMIHCQQQARLLNVGFRGLTVNAQANSGESPEEAARNARYQALQSVLAEDDVLLLAQHRDDQLETVLLQLFRGAGLQGLAAMPELTRFGDGWLARPLLNCDQAAIRQYAVEQQLVWIEDPSNQSRQFDRNYLRHEIVPRLKHRWPSLAKTVSRSAQHCNHAQQLIQTWTEEWFAHCYNTCDQTLSISSLLALQAEQIKLVLRHWFVEKGLRVPSQAVLQAAIDQVILARIDATPQLQSQGYALRRYQDKLFLLANHQFAKLQDTTRWAAEEARLRLANGTLLSRYSADFGISRQRWHHAEITVQARRGGESLKLAGRQGQHGLKKLYQESCIPPWERDARPLIYLDGQLAAVAGLWIDERFYLQSGEPCYLLRWDCDDKSPI